MSLRMGRRGMEYGSSGEGVDYAESDRG